MGYFFKIKQQETTLTRPAFSCSFSAEYSLHARWSFVIFSGAHRMRYPFRLDNFHLRKQQKCDSILPYRPTTVSVFCCNMHIQDGRIPARFRWTTNQSTTTHARKLAFHLIPMRSWELLLPPSPPSPGEVLQCSFEWYEPTGHNGEGSLWFLRCGVNAVHWQRKQKLHPDRGMAGGLCRFRFLYELIFQWCSICVHRQRTACLCCLV